jgi:multiple antibiotic resistance protein
MSLFAIAFSLFLLMDSIGNIPLYISFLKRIPAKRQWKIILREMVIALLIIILFYFLGSGLLEFLSINQYTIQMAGGIILFMICLKMVFPSTSAEENLPHEVEPFIVPLAVPLVAGPAVLAAVIIYSKQETNTLIMIGAIFIAWAASLIILLGSPFLNKILGWRGIVAIERLMGLVLSLIAIQMFLNGLAAFLKTCNVL